MSSITLSRVLITGGGFTIRTFNAVQFFHGDGSPAGSPSRPIPGSTVGLSLSSPPCLALSAETQHGSRFAIARAGFPAERDEPSREFERVDYYPKIGIVVGAEAASTRIHVLETGRNITLNRVCSEGVENAACGLVALPLADPGRSRWEIVVLDRSGDRILSRGLKEGSPETMALQGAHLILSFKSLTSPRDVALPLTGAVRILMPLLPRGLRTFSADGTHLLIRNLSTKPNELTYYDIKEPWNPVLLWKRVMPEGEPFVIDQAVSATGRFVAWQAQVESVRNSRLVVTSCDVIDQGRVLHDETHIISGVRFLDDRYLLEGVYRHGSTPATRTVRLYDLERFGSR